MRPRLGIVVVVVVATAGVAPAAAAGDSRQVGRTAALCSAEVEETGRPGWWLVTPGEVAVSAVGTLTCVGTVDGEQLTGRSGQLAWRGSHDGRPGGMRPPLVGNTCVTGSGSGIWEATLPTVDGSALVYRGPVDFVYVGATGVSHGSLGPFQLEMDWVFGPHLESSPDEDCVRKPFRQAVGRGAGTLR